MDESIEITTETPPSTTDIMTAIGQMRAEISEMRAAIHDDVTVRLQKVETIVAELPKVYASTESLDKVKTSQAGYEVGLRQLTGQVADVLNMQADNQQKFTSIESRLNELSGVKATVEGMKNALNTFTDNITVFMTTQRERLDNHDARLINNDRFVRELSGEVKFVKTTQADAEQRYNTGFKPVHDFIVGSETQKPMMAVIDGLHLQLNTMAQQLTPAVDYIAEQKKKEADRLSFWRAVRLQMWTWRGVLSMLLALVVVLIIANSINFDQLFERIRQLADVIAAVLRSIKVG